MTPVEASRSAGEGSMIPIAPRPISIASSASHTSINHGNGSTTQFARSTDRNEHGRPKSSQGSDRSHSSVSPSRTSANGHASGSVNNSSNPRIKKTLADTIASHQGVVPPRKRKRVHYSCAECHRRKHRCDRNLPCQPCLDRGLGDTCRPFSEGDEFGDERDRIKRLEDLVEGLARAHASMSDQMAALRKGNNFPQRDSMEVAEEEEDERNLNLKGSRPKKPRILSTNIDLEREELRKVGLLNEDSGHTGAYGGGAEEMLDGNNSLEGGLTREGDSFYGALALPSVSRGTIETEIHGERLELSANIPLRSASVKVHRLIQEGGAPNNVIEELMSCLPSRKASDDMLHWYFRDINDTRLPLHERTFRASYEEIMQWRWGDLRNEEGDDGARHIPFLSFLFVILAIAKRSEPQDSCSDEEARKGALFFLHCARRSMAIASAVRADHIDVLLAALFGARLLITLRQSAESWSLLGVAIRAAQAIGLHRDGTKLGLDAVTTERRRRLWALIYYLDRTTSMLLGRPQAIDERTTDCLPPCDVDIDVLPRMGPAPTPEPFPPLVPPTLEQLSRPPGVYRFIAIRHELARLTGRVVQHFQILSKPRNYADVLKLDADLQSYYAAFPPPYLLKALRGEEADRSFDDICPWLPIHRYLLNLEYHYVRITLHRPYLLRSERYGQSREAAFASAKADRLIRKEYSKEVKWPSNRARNAHLGGVYRLFSSTLIAGIELLLDPNGANAGELHEMLDDFLSSPDKAADPSQCTKRELAIIKIFKAKALDPSWNATGKTGRKESKGKHGQHTKRVQDLAKPYDSTMGALDLTPSKSSEGSESNELAQTLLDRLGGLETFGMLNQNHAQSPSIDIPTTSQQLGSAALGMGMVPSFGSLGAEGENNTGLTYNSSNIDSLFDSTMGFDGQERDWASFTDANTGSSSNLWNTDAALGQTFAPGESNEVGGDFNGWGYLVEAIASGKEGQENK